MVQPGLSRSHRVAACLPFAQKERAVAMAGGATGEPEPTLRQPSSKLSATAVPPRRPARLSGHSQQTSRPRSDPLKELGDGVERNWFDEVYVKPSL